MLKRTRTILHRLVEPRPLGGDIVRFGPAEADDPHDVFGGRLLILDGFTHQDMGAPDTITVTIEPGDLLNS